MFRNLRKTIKDFFDNRPPGITGIHILLILEEEKTALCGGDIWNKLDKRLGRTHHSDTVMTTIILLRRRGLIRESKATQGKPRVLYELTIYGGKFLVENRERIESLTGSTKTRSQPIVPDRI